MKNILLSIQIFILTIAFVTPAASLASSKSISGENGECVILLHGLARSNKSFIKMASTLQREGFYVINYNYPSTKYSISALANIFVKDAVSQCDQLKSTKTHFVTHSMGGILVRQYLSQNNLENLGNTVMLSPPNHGSEIIDTLRKWSVFSYVNVPSARQLNTSFDSVPIKLGATNNSIGVITGNRSFNPILSLLIPGDDDGKVSVESAKLDGMGDFLIVPHSHIFIMDSDSVIEQTNYFLRNMRFDKRR